MNFKTIAEILLSKGFPSDSFDLDSENNRFARLDVDIADALVGAAGYLKPSNKKYKNSDNYRIDLNDLLPQYVMNRCKVMISSKFRDMERDLSKDGLLINILKHIDAYRGFRCSGNIFYDYLEGNEEYKSNLQFPFDQMLQFEGFDNRFTTIVLSKCFDSENIFRLNPLILTCVDMIKIAYEEKKETKDIVIGQSKKVGDWGIKFKKEKSYHNAFYFLESLGYELQVSKDDWGNFWLVNDGSKSHRFRSEYAFIEYANDQIKLL